MHFLYLCPSEYEDEEWNDSCVYECPKTQTHCLFLSETIQACR